MGYRIVYGKDPFEQEQPRGGNLKMMTAAFALFFVLLVRLFWPHGTQLLQEMILPEENTAFIQLTEDIRAGEPMGDAVTTFCRTIVEEALAQAD